MRILIASGRAHLKHTEGGDFREASWRAVRQGLMHADSVLLEPFYNYRLIVPSELVGRAINDIRSMSGDFTPEPMPDGSTILTGSAEMSHTLCGLLIEDVAAESAGTFYLAGLRDLQNTLFRSGVCLKLGHFYSLLSGITYIIGPPGPDKFGFTVSPFWGSWSSALICPRVWRAYRPLQYLRPLPGICS